MKYTILSIALAVASPTAMAACPALSVYDVSNIQVDNVPFGEAVSTLLDGTAWTSNVSDEANKVRVSFRNVSGPLDQVLDKLISQSRTTAGAQLGVLRDAANCTVSVSAKLTPERPTAIEPAAKAVPPAATGSNHDSSSALQPQDVLQRGKPISEALSAFAQSKGWQVRWNVEDDFMVDVEIPVPRGYSVTQAVTWVIETYQMSGALRGVEPIFHTNSVVSIQKMKPELK